MNAMLSNEIKNYIKAESTVAAAFNFFINGMAAALIHHKADRVATDPVSIAIDLFVTCLSICVLTALFSRASVKRTKTAGIIESASGVQCLLSKLFRRPILFGAVTGGCAAVSAYIPTALIFTLPGITSIPFAIY
ncbi:MAG: hypothetical protein FWF03_08755, partial [Defluviitaleaceae bacterium]|nr:hypothetical protein [Defluviitaleaceae bacterium]